MSYKFAFLQIILSAAILVAMVPLHELGHVLLGYLMGQKVLFVQWLDFEALVQLPVNGIRGATLGYVEFDEITPFQRIVHDRWYHYTYYLIAFLVLGIFNGKLLHWRDSRNKIRN